MDVSIIIVNFNTKSLLKDCLGSIYEYTKNIEFEIIVSDNGSIDGSIEMLRKEFPSVILVENNSNLGFGAANNRGLQTAIGKYILYLNSDTVLKNNAVKIFYDYFEEHKNENLGAIGSNLLSVDGKIIHSYGNFPDLSKINKSISNLFHTIYGNIKLVIKAKFNKKNLSIIKSIPDNYSFYEGDVDYITGADLFVQNDENAFFDEKFFMYYEETDLQNKMMIDGLYRKIINGPEIIHLEGGSSKKEFQEILIEKSFSRIQGRISFIYYMKKHGVGNFKIYILKFLTIFLWCNPLIIKNNFKYFKKVLFI